MPRLPVGRMPAAPSSANQQERYQRILDAAVTLGSRTDFERVQMQDVAAEADVAIATLYRYFPSKAHLFVGVMQSYIEEVDPSAYTVKEGQSRAEAVHDLLAAMARAMGKHRQLSLSMIQSIILAYGQDSVDPAKIEGRFLDLLLAIAGWGQGTEDQRRRGWLVIQCWFGVLMTTLNGNRSLASAEADIRRACELLLAD